ncbi:hypothetical protein CUJ88_12515 [Paraburkholderia hospita]|nr:hypothetical protein CUJ88_12515 [Paraburkholderia hospita]
MPSWLTVWCVWAQAGSAVVAPAPLPREVWTETIRERLQALRRGGRIAYDPAITMTMVARIDEPLTRLDC